ARRLAIRHLALLVRPLRPADGQESRTGPGWFVLLHPVSLPLLIPVAFRSEPRLFREMRSTYCRRFRAAFVRESRGLSLDVRGPPTVLSTFRPATLLAGLSLALPAFATEPVVVDLWPGKTPSDAGIRGEETSRIHKSPLVGPTKLITNVSKPTLTVYRP